MVSINQSINSWLRGRRRRLQESRRGRRTGHFCTACETKVWSRTWFEWSEAWWKECVAKEVNWLIDGNLDAVILQSGDNLTKVLLVCFCIGDGVEEIVNVTKAVRNAHMKRWKVCAVFLNLNVIWMYWNTPNGVTTAVFGMSSGLPGISWKVLTKSMREMLQPKRAVKKIPGCLPPGTCL